MGDAGTTHSGAHVGMQSKKFNELVFGAGCETKSLTAECVGVLNRGRQVPGREIPVWSGLVRSGLV